MFVRINTIYSVFVGRTQSYDYCTNSEVAASSVLLIICVILGVASEMIDYFYVLNTNTVSKICINGHFTKLVTVGLITIVTFCLPFYIISDNFQPLDCAFGCDRIVANASISKINCNQRANSGTRLTLILITLFIVMVMSGTYFYQIRLAEINRKISKTNLNNSFTENKQTLEAKETTL